MKKRFVIKLSGQVFSMDQTKKLKDYATFFVTSKESREKINICVRAMYSMTIIICDGGYFSFCPVSVQSNAKKCFSS